MICFRLYASLTLPSPFLFHACFRIILISLHPPICSSVCTPFFCRYSRPRCCIYFDRIMTFRLTRLDFLFLTSSPATDLIKLPSSQTYSFLAKFAQILCFSPSVKRPASLLFILFISSFSTRVSSTDAAAETSCSIRDQAFTRAKKS